MFASLACFTAEAPFGIRARSVLMATGVVDKLPDLKNITEAIQNGTVRLCPICDGYEVINRRVAVMGPAEDALKKALFLRTFTRDVTMLVSSSGVVLDAEARDIIRKAGIERCNMPVVQFMRQRNYATGRRQAPRVRHPAMDCAVRSKLATNLGARCDEIGNLVVDAHQRKNVPGLCSWRHRQRDQPACRGIRPCGIAASDIHNRLAVEDGQRWPSET